MSDQLEIRTLGGLSIRRSDAAVDGFVSRKAEALLVYLACTRRAQPRPVLANLLWDEGSEGQMMNNLRVLLSSLRKEVGPYVTITRETAAFCRASRHWLDVAVLEEGLATIQLGPDSLCPEKVARAAETLSLYQGDFLHGFYLRGSRGFEEWLALERERLRLRILEALQQVVTASLVLGQYEAGLEYVGRLLQLDPLHEVAHRQKMFLLAVSGQRHAALTQYDQFRQLLADELGVAPTIETTTFYQQLQTGQLDINEWRGVADTSLQTSAPVPLPPCPYRGLSPFGEEDRPFFFGRKSFTTRLVEATRRHQVVAVVGPSGSGKSSVVMAGLLPQLRREPAPALLSAAKDGKGSLYPVEEKGWIIATFRPAGYPCRALAGALLPLLEPNLGETELLTEVSKLAQGFCQGELQPSDVIERILGKNRDKSHFLLVVDQLEEFYTQCPLEETCQHFLKILLQPVLTASANSSTYPAVGGPARVRLVLTLRADFLAPVLAYRPLTDALQDSMLILGSMTRHELGRAISQPAAGQGVTFEPGLVERILDDVGQQPGQLPLLEFALTTLWEQQDETYGQLTHAAYEQIGRVEGALAQYADRLYDSLNPAEQDQTRRVLVQLVRPGQQAEDARRQATRAELGEENWALAQRLSNARLVVTGRNPAGQETVELIHEALISEWERFAIWLKEGRAFRLWQERLRVLTRQWETSGRDEGALLRGALLTEAETWARIRQIDLGSNELAFLQASQALQGKERMAAKAQHQHELAQAQALARAEQQRAATQARASRRLGWLVISLTVMFIVAICGVMVAINQGRQAQEQAQLALGRQLAAQAQSTLFDHPDLALLLSVEANQLAEISGDRIGLPIDLLISPYLASFLTGHTGVVNDVVISPDGRILASASDDNSVILWDLVTGRPIDLPLTGHTDKVTQVAFSPDGTLLASGGLDNRVILWDVDSRQPLGPPLTGHQAEIVTVAFNPDGQQLVSASRDNTIIMWEVSQGQSVNQFLTRHTGGTKQVAVSPDGRILASVGYDSTISLWNAETGQSVGPSLAGHRKGVNRVTFSPDGTILASANSDQTIVLWSIETGQALGPPLLGHSGAVNNVAFSPDGSELASASADHTIVLWDVASGQPLALPLTAHHVDVLELAFSPDGQMLASSSANSTIVLWDITAARYLIAHNDAVNQGAFSPDGKLLASASDDGTIVLWDVATKRPLNPTPSVHKDGVLSVAFSPNGQMLATGGSDGSITVWHVETDQPPRAGALLDQRGPVLSIALSPDGQILASAGGDDNGIVLWDLITNQALSPPLTGHSNSVTSVAFSPDGQHLASGSADQTVILWDIATRQPFGQALTGHTDHILDVSFSPDGRLLASAGEDDTIRLWEVATGQPFGQPLTGHTGHVQNVAFSPDGRLLASGGRDNMIILWEVPSQEPYGFPLTGHQDWVQSVDVSPDGQLLASGSRDGSVILWQLKDEPWPVRACTIANRNLTQTEWRQFIGADLTYRYTCPDLLPD